MTINIKAMKIVLSFSFLFFTFAAGAQPYTVIAGGLANPRGLAFGPGSRLYVAVAGTGNQDSKIIEIRNPGSATPQIRDVLTGQLSLGPTPEGDFLGLSGLSAQGNGGIYAIIGESPQGVGSPQAGGLLKVTPAGASKVVTNVGSVDFAWSADHRDLSPRDFPDSNPYGVLALPGHVYVTDAGTNTLDEVFPDGSVSILAFFPDNLLADATPTCVAKGPDGALYIGTLALVDSAIIGPSAKVYRVDPNAVNPNDLNTILNVATVWANGLEPINGCAFGPNGDLYVSTLLVDFITPFGDVVKISFSDPSQHTSLTNHSFLLGGGLAIGNDGTVYVASFTTGTVPGGPVLGQVLKLTNK